MEAGRFDGAFVEAFAWPLACAFALRGGLACFVLAACLPEEELLEGALSARRCAFPFAPAAFFAGVFFAAFFFSAEAAVVAGFTTALAFLAAVAVFGPRAGFVALFEPPLPFDVAFAAAVFVAEAVLVLAFFAEVFGFPGLTAWLPLAPPVLVEVGAFDAEVVEVLA